MLAGLLITVYFAAGGLLTSAYVNMVQLTVKLLGFAVAIPFALRASGRMGGGARAAAHARLLEPSGRAARRASSISRCSGPRSSWRPGCCRRSTARATTAPCASAWGSTRVALTAYAVVPPLLGMMARAQFPDLAQPELALPTLLMSGVPAFVGALGLAAVFSAELSSADAVLFSLTTSLSQDFYKRFRNPQATDAQLLRVTRATAVLAGIAGVGVALVAAGVVSALSIFYTIMGVSLFVPILAGLYDKGARSADVLVAIVAGIAIVGGWRLFFNGAPAGGVTPAMGGLGGRHRVLPRRAHAAAPLGHEPPTGRRHPLSHGAIAGHDQPQHLRPHRSRHRRHRRGLWHR